MADMRLVDANALIEIGKNASMGEVFPEWDDLPHSAQNAVCRYAKHLRRLIESMPTVDAVRVLHGRWAFAGLWEECSVCKHPIAVDEPRTNFCPNCGAKMDLEVAENG